MLLLSFGSGYETEIGWTLRICIFHLRSVLFLVHQEAATDVDCSAGDKRGVIAGKKDYRTGYFLWLCQATQRGGTVRSFNGCGIESVAQHRCVYETWRYNIDVDLMGSESAGQSARHRHDTSLRRIVDDRSPQATCPPAL